MKILNPAVRADLDSGKLLRLNLGCGARPRPGFYGVDHLPLPGVDILADLNEPLSDLPDHSVSEVFTHHTLEHVNNLLGLMREIHRVLAPTGRIEAIMPHFSNPYAYSDPTHVRFFGLYTFYYFADAAHQPRRKVPSFYMAERFQVESVKCSLIKQSWLEKLTRPLVQRLINRNVEWLDWYERRLCWLVPAESIRYVLRPIKGTPTALTSAA